MDKSNIERKNTIKKKCGFLNERESLKINNSTIPEITIEECEKFSGASNLKNKKQLTVNQIEHTRRNINKLLYNNSFLM